MFLPLLFAIVCTLRFSARLCLSSSCHSRNIALYCQQPSTTPWIYFAAKYTYFKWHSKPIMAEKIEENDDTSNWSHNQKCRWNGKRFILFSFFWLTSTQMCSYMVGLWSRVTWVFRFTGEIPDEFFFFIYLLRWFAFFSGCVANEKCGMSSLHCF